MSDFESKDGRKKKLGADFLLLANAFFWGITIVIVKEAVEQVGVFFFLQRPSHLLLTLYIRFGPG